MASGSPSIRVEPVFFKNSDVPHENNQWLGTYEICKACSLVVNTEKNKDLIDGAQKIGDLWRVYLKDEVARIKLLSQGITLRGQQVELKDKNPFVIIGFEGVETTRLFIRNVPLSFDNSEIEDALKSKGVQLVNSMKYSRARDPDGKLTNFKTGDRFVDILVPDEPLPKKLSVGIFTASLYHKEQKHSMGDIECGNCMLKGHVRKDCPNETVCYECRTAGHKKGDPECPSVQGNIIDDTDANSHTSVNHENESEESESEDENEDKDERTVSQMLKGALTAEESNSNQTKEPVTPKPSGQKTENKEKQCLMTSFVSGSLQPGQPGSRSGSPAGRRKLADRSPDIDMDSSQKQKDKKTKKTHKNK